MSQEIQPHPSSNHSEEYESEATSNPVPSNRPLQIPTLEDVRNGKTSSSFVVAMSSTCPGSPLHQMSREIQSHPSSNHSEEYEYEAPSFPTLDRALSIGEIVLMNDYQQERAKEREERKKYLETYLPLYEASLRCDWKAAAAILDKKKDMELVRCKITENGDTALHIAASANAPKEKVVAFVKNLVERMTPEDLKLVNNNHSTALYLAAAAGNIESVKIMMEKNPTLDTIPGGGGNMMPLYTAVLFGHKDVAEYLYERSDNLECWYLERDLLLEKCVESDMFDIALKIVKINPLLGPTHNLFVLLARKPEAFHENKSSYKESNIIKRSIKSVSAFIGYKVGTPVKKSDALPLLRFVWGDILKDPDWDIDYLLNGPTDSIKSGLGRIAQTIQLKLRFFSHLEKLDLETQMILNGDGTEKEVSKLHVLVSKYVVDMHSETQSLIKKENTTDEYQALELQKLISEYIVKFHHQTNKTKKILDNPVFSDRYKLAKLQHLISDHIKKIRAEIEIHAEIETRDTHSSRVMFIAAEVGNTNFLLELIRRRPDLIWQVDDNGLSIFHVAVKHRHEGIYNLLYEIGSMKDMVTPLKDKDGNNMLHLAAMSTKKKNLEDVSGAALRMQRELLWFEEVERMIPPSSRVSKNKDGFTPRELFTMEHQHLIDQGEKWLKETASQCMVVAALIATIVFAAAFTVPGGYDQNDGIPMFKRKLSFVAFVVADAISLFLSSASILTFLSILTSRYAERDFVASLPKKLMLGLTTLFLSIGAMMVTFSVSFFVLYHKGMKWIPIVISILAIIPAILYVALQYHVLKDVFRSTYGGKYLFKPTRQVLFYENPKV